MASSYYKVVTSRSASRFFFVSIGIKGSIPKLVEYTPMHYATNTGKILYNLSFGDLSKDGVVNDKINTNNGDAEKVLMTIGFSTIKFIDNHPEAAVFFTGSDDIRSRYYQMIIRKYFNEISEMFTIFALGQNGWDFFDLYLNLNYSAFIVVKK